ncbi:metallophosphoesterase [Leifsonia sp. NPDC102414]|uniref:metallophosphoesterase n=1 Tax=Leifsonia sp. NPDC102414 TaxID=3364124 RepID=UPI00382F0671
MALLLHLSDLHLTRDAQRDALADHKVRVIPYSAASNRTSMLKDSLTGLAEALTRADRSLDSILVTGDVTVAGAPDGFGMVSEVLDALGDKRPSRERILITPGNHDVDRNAVGDARFAAFQTLRMHGYLTSWLSDDDIHTYPPPVLTAADGSFVVAGLNSSMFSGSHLETEESLAPFLNDLENRGTHDDAIRALLAAWRIRGNADIAWASNAELAALRPLLPAASTDLAGPLRIVGMHHQILPVSTTEEIKPFESFLNLGHLRHWLASNHIDLVLHGHKHHENRFTDRIDVGTSAPHELTILSAPSILDATQPHASIGRLIDIPAFYPRASGLRVIDVPVVSAGEVITLNDMPTAPVVIDSTVRAGTIEGKNVNQVYARILAILPDLPALPVPLVCRIEDGATARYLPNLMPDAPDDPTERERWLETIIDWWQRDVRGKAAEFNHGEHLRFRNEQGKTVVERMADELRKKAGSSRAIAVLVNQTTIHGEKGFPAFVSLQFVWHDDQIDAIAYFRKQEMPHWWPINTVEIARLQKEIVASMQGNRTVRAGSIVTVTAMPVAGTGMPTVSVPDLDLRADQPAGMLDLVLPLLKLAPANPERTMRLWERAFKDWTPSDTAVADGDPRPRVGVELLRDTLNIASDLSGQHSALVGDLVNELESIVDLNRNYDERDRGRWATSIHRHNTKVLELVNQLAREG